MTGQRAERLSNLELLRIVSMMMVLAVHIDGASLGFPDLKGNASLATSRDAWILTVEAFTIIGVNCFTLISGYFGIKFRWKSIGAYLFQCVFYSVGIYTLASLLTPLEFSWTKWVESWMVLTHTDLWYVPAYFFLMLLAPFINAGFSALTKTQTLTLTLLFLLFNVWAGWWWGGAFNPTGYTVVQLVLMYMIGRCIALFFKNDGTDPAPLRADNNFLLLGLYIILSLLTALYATWNPAKAFAYNSPFVIAESVVFFLIFTNLRFRSPFINYAAKSAFAVYLIHKAPLVWGNIMRPGVIKLWNSTTLGQFSFYAFVAIIVIYAICMVADFVRRRFSALIFK